MTASMSVLQTRVLLQEQHLTVFVQTYSGPFLVAVNPYRRLDGYYTSTAVQRESIKLSLPLQMFSAEWVNTQNI